MKINFINILTLLVVVNLNSLKANVVTEVDTINNPNYVSERPVPYTSVDGDLYIEDTSPANPEVPGLYVEGVSNLTGGLVLEGMAVIPLYASGGAYMSADQNRKVVLGENEITSSADNSISNSTSWGLAISAIDRTAGTLLFHEEYNLWGSNSEYDRMANYLAALEDGSVIIVITSHFVWSIGWLERHEELFAQLQRMGASNKIQDQYYNYDINPFSLTKNYTLIGIPGIGSGNGIEIINEDTPENDSEPPTMKTAEVNTLLIRGGATGKYLPLGLGFGSSGAPNGSTQIGSVTNSAEEVTAPAFKLSSSKTVFADNELISKAYMDARLSNLDPKITTLVNPATGTPELSVNQDGSVQLTTPGGDVSMGAFSE